MSSTAEQPLSLAGVNPSTAVEDCTSTTMARDKMWSTVLDTVTKFDEKMIEDWKDDIQNLLIFTGLFSSVVVSFASQSYTWLQPDSTDTAATLLAQISQQLSSFSVANGFINSTLPLSSIAAQSFAPSQVAIDVNVLWMLSLGVSLVTALFAILVLQWLHEYKAAAQYTSIRNQARIREMRFTALETWAVPHIVQALPVFLQTSLILFLVGLMRLLESINKTVFTPFVVFVGLSLRFYILTLVAPCLSKTCPYKSSQSFYLATCAIFFLHTMWFISMLFVSIVFVLFPRLITGMFTITPQRGFRIWLVLVWRRMWRMKIAIQRGWAQGGGVYEFWSSRERRHLRFRDQQYDNSVLMSVLPWLPYDNLQDLRMCIPDVSPWERPGFTCLWVLQSLNITFDTINLKDAASDGSYFDSSILKQIENNWHGDDIFFNALLESLPSRWTSGSARDASDEIYAPATLIILRQIARSPHRNIDTLPLYAQRLMSLVRFQQQASSHEKSPQTSVAYRLPTIALYDCLSSVDFCLPHNDVLDVIDWANILFSVHIPTLRGRTISRWPTSVDILLASAATALLLVARTMDVPAPGASMNVQKLLNNVMDFIRTEVDLIESLVSQSRGDAIDGVPYVSPTALRDISCSMRTLAANERLASIIKNDTIFLQTLENLSPVDRPVSTQHQDVQCI